MKYRLFVGAAVLSFLFISQVMSLDDTDNLFPKEDYQNLPELEIYDSSIGINNLDETYDSISVLLYRCSDNDTTTIIKKQVALYHRLSLLKYLKRQYDAADSLYHITDSLIRLSYGENSLRRAILLVDKGNVRAKQQLVDSAIQLYSQAIEMIIGISGEFTPALLNPCYRLCDLAMNTYTVTGFQPYLSMAQKIIEKADGIDSYYQCEHLFYQGAYYYLNNRNDSALAFFNAAAEMADDNHILFFSACARSQISVIEYNNGRPIQADSIMSIALEQAELYWQGGSPELIEFYVGRAYTSQITDDLVTPQKLLAMAEDICLHTVGDTHPYYGMILDAQTILYKNIGNYKKAFETARRSLVFMEKVHGVGSEQYNMATSSLALLYLETNNYDEAIPLLRLAVKYNIENWGEESQATFFNRAYLAYAEYLAGNYASADSAYSILIPQVERLYGMETYKTGETYTSAGLTYCAEGKFEEAEAMLLKASDIYRRVFPPFSYYTSTVYEYLGKLYGIMGKYEEGAQYFKKQLELRNDYLANAFAYTSAGQKLQYLMNMPLLSNPFMSLALKSGNKEAILSTYEMLCQSKSFSVDAIASEIQMAQYADDDDIKSLYDNLSAVTTSISNLTNSLEGVGAVDRYRPILDSLINVRNDLESEMSDKCQVASREVFNRKATIDEIIAHIPGGALLLEFGLYSPYDYDTERVITGFGCGEPFRYLLYVLDSTGIVGLHEIGPEFEISTLVYQLNDLIEKAPASVFSEQGIQMEKQYREKARELYTRLFAPVIDRIEQYDKLILATDGLLQILPFETLVTEQNKYVIEQFKICYVTSGKDLVRFSEKPSSFPTSLSVYSNPAFDADVPVASAFEIDTGFSDSADMFVVRPARNIFNCFSAKFSDLKNTRIEADDIISLLQPVLSDGVSHYTGIGAAEDTVKSMSNHSGIIHFATHGFVCPSTENRYNDTYLGKMLHSGLALAGANRILDSTIDILDGSNDGILTALEISGLNFHNTELVALSACETGLGQVSACEGVFGLRRAFQLAGANTLLVSLRRVSDEQCTQFMHHFYSEWLIQHKTKSEAMRTASLNLLEDSRAKREHGHPFFWSGFILVGNPN